MKNLKRFSALVFIIFLSEYASSQAFAYPIDGYAETGIRRLERARLISQKEMKGNPLPPGALKKIEDIKLNLLGIKLDYGSAFTPDAELQKRIDALFLKKNPNYAFAVLDITPGRARRFAARKAEHISAPGSVGKLAIAAGLFTELKNLFPKDIDKRRDLLKNRIVKADQWIISNHHEVPVFNMETRAFSARRVVIGDTFTLYEWADHMLSASSNASASIVWKEVILMRAFGKYYPPSEEDEAKFFKETPKGMLKELALTVVNEPLRTMGIAENQWQLGSFFTSTGKKIIPGAKSYATPLAFLVFLLRMEEGNIVDKWSSLELKRFLYMTVRRIRYVSSEKLKDAAVYFKSGSQYKCRPEPGYSCGKYMGNAENHLNAVAVIEHTDGTIYMIALMSNVLKKNSALDHNQIATEVDIVIRGN